MLSFYFQLLHVEHFHLASLSLPSLSSSLPWRDFARCKICIFWPALFFSLFYSLFFSFFFLLSYWQSNAIYTPRLRVSGLATLYWPDLFANFCAPMWKTLLAYSPFFPSAPTPKPVKLFSLFAIFRHRLERTHSPMFGAASCYSFSGL